MASALVLFGLVALSTSQETATVTSAKTASVSTTVTAMKVPSIATSKLPATMEKEVLHTFLNQALSTNDDDADSETMTSGSGGSSLASASPKASAPTHVGPIFVVWLTFPNGSGPRQPAKNKTEILDLMCGTGKSWSGVLQHSSWGQTSLDCADVYFHEMESTTDPAIWAAMPQIDALSASISKVLSTMPKFYDGLRAAQLKHGDMKYYMFFYPGQNFQAAAFYPPTPFSILVGTAITWQTMAHEIGHNFGLRHAGGFFSSGFEQYADDALMGYQRTHRDGDFTSVARYNLGWIPVSQVAQFPSLRKASVRALNEGPKRDGNTLLMVFDCPTCLPGNPSHRNRGGTLYASFRVEDPTSQYGIDKTFAGLRQYRSQGVLLTLMDTVHLHFQGYTTFASELWTTIGVGSTYKVPDSPLWIHVCNVITTPNNQHRMITQIGASDTSEDDARNQCLRTQSEWPCATNSDSCLQQSPWWGERYTCASSTGWCTSWAKDMHRCCPSSCNVAPVCDVASCKAVGGRGSCIYPNPALVQTTTTTTRGHAWPCAANSDLCLQQSSRWGERYTCASSTGWCTTWAKDMHRCCPGSCNVAPVCDVASCKAVGGRGSCIYPNPALVQAPATTTTRVQTVMYSYAQFLTGACRGLHSNDNPSSWYATPSGFAGTLQDCQSICTSNSRCRAVEFKVGENNHCEIWTTEPQATSGDVRYTCMKKAPTTTTTRAQTMTTTVPSNTTSENSTNITIPTTTATSAGTTSVNTSTATTMFPATTADIGPTTITMQGRTIEHDSATSLGRGSLASAQTSLTSQAGGRRLEHVHDILMV